MSIKDVGWYNAGEEKARCQIGVQRLDTWRAVCGVVGWPHRHSRSTRVLLPGRCWCIGTPAAAVGAGQLSKMTEENDQFRYDP